MRTRGSLGPSETHPLNVPFPSCPALKPFPTPFIFLSLFRLCQFFSSSLSARSSPHLMRFVLFIPLVKQKILSLVPFSAFSQFSRFPTFFLFSCVFHVFPFIFPFFQFSPFLLFSPFFTFFSCLNDWFLTRQHCVPPSIGVEVCSHDPSFKMKCGRLMGARVGMVESDMDFSQKNTKKTRVHAAPITSPVCLWPIISILSLTVIIASVWECGACQRAWKVEVSVWRAAWDDWRWCSLNSHGDGSMPTTPIIRWSNAKNTRKPHDSSEDNAEFQRVADKCFDMWFANRDSGSAGLSSFVGAMYDCVSKFLSTHVIVVTTARQRQESALTTMRLLERHTIDERRLSRCACCPPSSNVWCKRAEGSEDTDIP